MEIEPIKPFEPIMAVDIPLGDEWISQIKWDGVRILTYYDGKKLSLFNRKLNERTYHYPELADFSAYCKAKSVILDGEIIALDHNGNPSFHEVMRRDGLRNVKRVKEVMQEVTIYYMVFDVIYYNGEWVNNQPLRERLQLLSRIVKPTSRIQVVPVEQEGHTLFKVVQQRNMEGIICKNLHSKYIINGKNSDWKKIKNYKDVIAVIGGVTYRSGIVNSMLLGLYDQQKQFWYIGNVGTGKLTNEDWRKFTEIIEPVKIQNKPFVNQPESIKKVQWLKPVLTVKVNYIEWPEGRSLRQPSIQAFMQITPTECKLPQDR
ncbi:MAG: RNA ligase family protein [Bacillus sp. (in: firmicutes)]